MGAPVYADLNPRLRAALIDYTLILLVIVFGGKALSEIELAGAVKFSIMALAVFALEPLLVSLKSATVGQLVLGLRVLDAQKLVKISLLSATLRFAMKTFFGFYSLLFIMLTSRSQAFHDDVCDTVVIDARPESRPWETTAGRRRLEDPAFAYPTDGRRILMIFIYLILWAMLIAFTNGVLVWLTCGNGYACIISRETGMALQSLADIGLTDIVNFAIFAIIIVLGWQGRLPGTRRKPLSQ